MLWCEANRRRQISAVVGAINRCDGYTMILLIPIIELK